METREDLLGAIRDRLDSLEDEELERVAGLLRHKDPIVWDLTSCILTWDDKRWVGEGNTHHGVAFRLLRLQRQAVSRHKDPIVWDLIARLLNWARVGPSEAVDEEPGESASIASASSEGAPQIQ